MQQVDDPPSLHVGTEVSAKYKGAFCEAKVSKVVRNIKIKVAYKQGLGSGIVSDDLIKAAPGQLRVGATVEVRHPDRKELVEATITKIQDCSQYTVVFDDGDITTLRRTALCLKSGRHFNESETLDQLPLTHPEHFGNPVVGGRRGRRRGQATEDSSEEEEESDAKEVVNEKEENIGKVVCVETEWKKKDKEKWFPALVVAPTAQATVRIRVKDEYLVRSFKDGRYYTVPKKEAPMLTRDVAAKQAGPAVQAALEFLDNEVLPAHWDRETLFGLSQSSSEDEADVDSDSSDDEPHEEKDRFVAQLYKYMDDRGTPLNKVPVIQCRDLDLYRLFRTVQKRGGYNRVTHNNQWKAIAARLGFTPVTNSIINLVKQAFKKFLQPYGEFNRKLGCSMLTSPRNSNRSKGRSLVRASSVASPKPADTNKDIGLKGGPAAAAATATTAKTNVATATTVANAQIAAVADESENSNESANLLDTVKGKRKGSIATGKVKGLVEKFEEKTTIKDENDVPLAKMKAAAATFKQQQQQQQPQAIDEKEKEREATSVKQQCSRDSSPASSIFSSAKKDKQQQRKQQQDKPALIQTTQNDEKRGKRKKEEHLNIPIIVEKLDAISTTSTTTTTALTTAVTLNNPISVIAAATSTAIPNDQGVDVGDKLKVFYHEKKVTYEAKVIEITMQQNVPMYLVHYTGWNNRYDEWVPRERIAENLTKCVKHKGRFGSNGGMEKNKENPPKPPTLASLNAASTATATGGTAASTGGRTTTAVAKRGRGRSDSIPTRSTTPSSTSSRTKSPAASSNVKRRPARALPSNNAQRRTSATSANVSDISMHSSNTDTDSDEPVRTKLSRHAKGSTTVAESRKSSQLKRNSKDSRHSQSGEETDDNDDDNDDEAAIEQDDDDDDADAEIQNLRSIKKQQITAKGRDYDLNQIRSELKGFPGLKSPTPPATAGNEAVIKKEKDSATITNPNIKIEMNLDTHIKPLETPLSQLKTENKTFATDISFEMESVGDDDSQSSDKTTTLENMTEKFQQKINADKQRALKQPLLSSGSKILSERSAPALIKTRVVEKIIKESNAEKRQEGLKSKPLLKDETKSSVNTIKVEAEITNAGAVKFDATGTAIAAIGAATTAVDCKKDEDKKPLISIALESKSSLIAPARFGANAAAAATGSKYASVIMEKPLSVTKKTEPLTKASTSTLTSMHKKDVTDLAMPTPTSTVGPATVTSQKKYIETSVQRSDILKVDSPAAAGSPSSNSCSSNSSTSTSTSNSSRSLPDMSKLDISGSSLSSSSFTNVTKETKPYAANITNIKPTSVDIYEFKDTEPFEFELRKSPMAAAAAAGTTPRKAAMQKTTAELTAMNPMTALINRATRKRGSPLKEALTPEKNKLNRGSDEKSPIVADSKLAHHVVANKALPTTATTTALANSSKTDVNAFDVLRSRNMSALNEELAQTVQETTRALQTAPAAPTNIYAAETTTAVAATTTTASETALIETKGSNSQQAMHAIDVISSNSALPATPAKTAVTVAASSSSSSSSNIIAGSPFLETRKDLTNVFELSSSNEGCNSSSDTKDNKLELVNLKKLLSGSSADFDLMEAHKKIEGKPVSIADKLLNAINQKKVEEENKIKENQVNVAAGGEAGKPETATATTSTVTTAAIALKTALDLPIVNNSGSSNSNSNSTPTTPLLKRTPLTSPELNKSLGLLESRSIKNDLHQTIQKLESAIQRKTPVGVASTAVARGTPTSLTAPNLPSDDSNDSTDSEQRLVIEDVSEEIALATATATITTLTATTPPILSKKAATATTTNAVVLQAPVAIKAKPLEAAVAEQLQQQADVKKATLVVPIELPNIPISVVVASSAMPAVVAAAQAAAANANENSTTTTILTATSSSNNSTTNSNNNNSISSSGFYLDAARELRPEDGVKPISDAPATLQRNNDKSMLLQLKSTALAETRNEANAADALYGSYLDVHNDPINLLCEETIPGSPAPAFGGKEEPTYAITATVGAATTATARTLTGIQHETATATPSTLNRDFLALKELSPSGTTAHSSPNDSGSQDDSSEELKRNIDADMAGAMPRKRRRARKQSESVAAAAAATIAAETKRRRVQLTALANVAKKNAAASDSEENSDNIAVSNAATAASTQQLVQQMQQQQQQQQQQSNVAGIRPCPYNFLVQLDPSLSSDQCIAILLKQIQDLRKTYNMIKSDLASIDRRRKKLRRREREKKQHLLSQQQAKVSS